MSLPQGDCPGPLPRLAAPPRAPSTSQPSSFCNPRQSDILCPQPPLHPLLPRAGPVSVLLATVSPAPGTGGGVTHCSVEMEKTDFNQYGADYACPIWVATEQTQTSTAGWVLERISACGVWRQSGLWALLYLILIV